MATFVKFESFAEAMGEKKHNLAADTLKLALSNTAPTAATDTQLSNITQISAGNGYTTGGQALDTVTFTEAAGVATLDALNEVFTASGGAMAQFRYVVLYNDTASNDELIGYWDNGSAIDLPSGETFTVTFDAAGILTVA